MSAKEQNIWFCCAWIPGTKSENEFCAYKSNSEMIEEVALEWIKMGIFQDDETIGKFLLP